MDLNTDVYDGDEEKDKSLKLMKMRILALQKDTLDPQKEENMTSTCSSQEVKQMDQVALTEYTREILEDITEESERNSLSTAEEHQSLSLEQTKPLQVGTQESNISLLPQISPSTELEPEIVHVNSADECGSSGVRLNMFKLLEQKISELKLILISKDACLSSLQLQLDHLQKRDHNCIACSSTEQPGSCRDTSSLTNSTEYRTLQEEIGVQTPDMLLELTERDEIIAKLTESLKQSMDVREKLQKESENLYNEIHLLRKQVNDAMEISIDFKNADVDYSKQEFSTECKFKRPKEEKSELDWNHPFSTQIDQFQKYLTPTETNLFFAVQKKFNDYLCAELEKCRERSEHEFKIALDKLEAANIEKDKEIQKLLLQWKDKEELHSKEMEDLRKYFENKCAELEKQFSDDVFSQKHCEDSSTECETSEGEQNSDKIPPILNAIELSSRKRVRDTLLNSPSHRQITPVTIGNKDEDDNINIQIDELKLFYQNKIQELQLAHDQMLRRVTEKIKYYEKRYPDDEFMNDSWSNTTVTTCNAISSVVSNDVVSKLNNTNPAFINIGTPNISTMSTVQLAQENRINDEFKTSLIIIDQDEINLNNESLVIQKIISEYERRLQEQVAFAREDIVHELEQQIQNLLSETTSDDRHWPKELILLREKFTAKSQLEIAQLQIKHGEEMSRLRSDYEKQLNRKFQRNITFDSAREYNQIICERDGLRELSKSFRFVLYELAKFVATCEEDLNSTIFDEVQRHLECVNYRTFNDNVLNQSVNDPDQSFTNNTTLNNSNFQLSKRLHVPDVQGIIEVVENPNLLEYISKNNPENSEDFDINECLERLNREAAYLLTLSEQLGKNRTHLDVCDRSIVAKPNNFSKVSDAISEFVYNDYMESKFHRANSLNEQQLSQFSRNKTSIVDNMTSLPLDLSRIKHLLNDGSSITIEGNASDLHLQIVELKNRLTKSEGDRHKLQIELENTITLNSELGNELQVLRNHLSQLNSLNQTEYAEGYGLGILNGIQNAQVEESKVSKSQHNFTELQERARHLLASPRTQQQQLQSKQQYEQYKNELPSKDVSDAPIVLLQMIEDFCREGDKMVEMNKKDREDLQAQIDTADKQLKATRQFLEEQAGEREQERDEFVREIENLKSQLRDIEKERSTYAIASEEVLRLENQIRDLTQKLNDSQSKSANFEVELKAAIDKIFVLREIITELETQVETKSLNEHVQAEKIMQLEEFINTQNRSIEALQNEVETLKLEIDQGYQARIRVLEEKLQNVRPKAEQSMVMDRVMDQLRDIENALDQKTRSLEALHNTPYSNSCSLSVTEDISITGSKPNSLNHKNPISPPQGSPVHPSPRQHSFTMEVVQRIIDKLSKHTRVEEAAIKRIVDLDMQVLEIRNSYAEIQQERDCLQERMCEQTQRISALQLRLEEQRQRAEDLQRSNTTDLNIRIHDLQSEVQILNETLSSRDKQLATMKQQLEKSKSAIDRLEAELLVQQNPDRSQIERLESDIKQKNNEINKLKDKIKNEMINKLALPDLMETMLADKNDEIDHLREQVEAKEKELQTRSELNICNDISFINDKKSSNGEENDENMNLSNIKEECNSKLSARTLSDIISISEYDEPDVVRRIAIEEINSPLLLPEGNKSLIRNFNINSSKELNIESSKKHSKSLSACIPLQAINTFQHPHYFQDPNIQAAASSQVHLSSAGVTPGLIPRQINFSDLTEDSKVTTPNFGVQSPDQIKPIMVKQQQLPSHNKEESCLNTETNNKLVQIEQELICTIERLQNVQEELQRCKEEIQRLNDKDLEQTKQINLKTEEIKQYLSFQHEQAELLTKQEKDIFNYKENEKQYQQRIESLEKELLEITSKGAVQAENLRKELHTLSEAHAQCKRTLQDIPVRKAEIESLNEEIKCKDECLLEVNKKVVNAEQSIIELKHALDCKDQEINRLLVQIKKQQQQNSESSSRQFSVDEIAQQVENELNYSAQLDSYILKAIESEEENNFDNENQIRQEQKHAHRKFNQKVVTSVVPKTATNNDDNFTGERVLLNELEALRIQINMEREQCEAIRKELLLQKQHSQDIQEQDVVIIESMRKRLENSLAKENELHKQLDLERERCERFQTQLTVLQRSESRRNSSILLKSPHESPRKSPRQHTHFESELAERLRSEIKMLSAQNERERERFNDLQRNTERERQRHDIELQERISYCERLKSEMNNLSQKKDDANREIEHLQERLKLQTSEIESLETRLVSLQESETRRTSRNDRHQKENTQLLIELQEIKTRLLASDNEREQLTRTIIQLRKDLECSSIRHANLTEALNNANEKLASTAGAAATVPQQFLQKMKEINALLAQNTEENRQMAETVQFLVEERKELQKKCEEFEHQLCNGNIAELEERCNYLFGRYLRGESHRKALVYQKRYLKMSLQRYQDNEQRVYEHLQPNSTSAQLVFKEKTRKKKLFKTVALVIIAIERIKYIGRIWQTGKRIVSKSVFTVTQQKRNVSSRESGPTVTSAKQNIEIPTSE